jgi:hypothetical protein
MLEAGLRNLSEVQRHADAAKSISKKDAANAESATAAAATNKLVVVSSARCSALLSLALALIPSLHTVESATETTPASISACMTLLDQVCSFLHANKSTPQAHTTLF